MLIVSARIAQDVAFGPRSFEYRAQSNFFYNNAWLRLVKPGHLVYMIHSGNLFVPRSGLQ